MAIGERLRMARKMARMSQQDLGEAAGVSRMAISKYERDEMDPSSGVLIALARALGVKVAYLLRPVAVKVSEPAFRKRTALGRKRQASIVERVRDWLDRYLTVEDLLREQTLFTWPVIDRSILEVADAEQVAVSLREAWDLGSDSIDNLTEILEHQGIKVGFVEGDDAFDALTLWADDDTPVIVVKQDIPGDRQRLNIAHELGHILLEIPPKWDHRQEESAAYRFAGALLMPASVVIRELGQHRERLDPYELHLLRHAYGLSMQAIIRRAKDLGVISESVYVRVCREFSRLGWRREEPGDQIDPERSERMKRLILRALAEEIITRSRASELLGQSLSDFWEAERQHHSGFPEPVHR
ncbi:MAG: ImmA/IrrE family metallo-endopeptidase [Anaerolineae bacterium]|nr:ImmA/IrrE family metallo-endopeptidase [Anaerolineae bacterium]